MAVGGKALAKHTYCQASPPLEEGEFPYVGAGKEDQLQLTRRSTIHLSFL